MPHDKPFYGAMKKREGEYQKPMREYPPPEVEEKIIEDMINEETFRVQVRLSGEVLQYLQKEAKRTATSVSALAALAITDWVDERRARQNAAGSIIPRVPRGKK